MINRYEVKDLSILWEDKNKFSQYLRVEIALLKALEWSKKIPTGCAAAFEKVEIKPERIEEIEKITHHDVISFCTSITEQVDPKWSKYFHFGATSSDIIDTALSLQIRDSLALVVSDLKQVLNELKKKIETTKHILAIGRSHGMHGEPLIFAQKFLNFFQEFQRRLDDYERATQLEITGQLSGAVGSYTILGPEIEAYALNLLKLPVEKTSSQVISRDHIAKIVSIGALTASALERMSVELRQLHQSDVGEIEEGFAAGQKGSSTMPHKKNPIAAENLSGIARIIKSHMQVALENNVLWYERDISHSSAERLFLPDHFGLLCYALRRMARTLQNLVIKEERIASKVKQNPQVLSSYILHQLILTQDKTREELYQIVQGAFFKAMGKDNFLEIVKQELLEQNINLKNLEISWDSLESHYKSMFEEILKRSH
ncbi:MAG: adenylosuccinate lyase [Bacteriovoracaceae bacterium]|nr:adenylosuccinate lyase [Bacteriovoracaceae bacterium]